MSNLVQARCALGEMYHIYVNLVKSVSENNLCEKIVKFYPTYVLKLALSPINILLITSIICSRNWFC